MPIVSIACVAVGLIDFNPSVQRFHLQRCRAYLDLAYEERRLSGRMTSLSDLREAIVHGAVKRIRPKFMTVATMVVGLAPIMWSAGAGADVMKRIAAPMIGGIFTSFLLELLVYPVVYEVWKWHFELKRELARS